MRRTVRQRLWRQGLLICVVATAALAATASANVPRFSYKRPSIVPGKAMGGVRVGMTEHQAKAHWGAPDRCFARAGVPIDCQYKTNQHVVGGGTIYDPFADFYVGPSGRVVAIQVGDPANAAVSPKVHRLRTSKGIKIGSSMAAARHRYGLPAPGGGEAGLSRGELKNKNRCTLFYAPEAPYKTITSIEVGICRSQIGLYF